MKTSKRKRKPTTEEKVSLQTLIFLINFIVTDLFALLGSPKIRVRGCYADMNLAMERPHK